MITPHSSHLPLHDAAIASDAKAGMLEVVLCNERVQLLAQRAMFWPRERALFVADIHLGKAASFRAGGVPVPRGATATDLQRLTDVIARTHAQSLYVLGDFLHAAAGRVDALDTAFMTWRAAHSHVALTLVRGNHDAKAGDPPARWNVAVVTEPHPVAPFLLCHLPLDPTTGYALCGHVHPGAWVSGAGYESVRLPCFVLGRRRALLPAFGRFTGLATVQPKTDERVIGIAGERLFALPNSL